MVDLQWKASPSGIWLAGTLPTSWYLEFQAVHMHSLFLLWNMLMVPAGLAFAVYYLYKCLIFLPKIHSVPSVSRR